MSWPRRIDRVVDHVRSNLDGDLRAAALAKVACASPFHFSRIFKATTGETPARFVQRARLERAAALLRARPQARLSDVALEVGFCEQSDFTRVFKAHYGVAPSRWDRQARLQDSLPGYEDGLAAARATCPPFSAVVRDHPACRIGYVRVPTPFFDTGILAAGYAELTAWFEGRGIDWTAQRMLGLSWDNPETTPLDKVRFDLGFTLPAGVETDGELSTHRFGPIRAVEAHVQGPLAHIALAWEYLYEGWIAKRGVDVADLPGIKRFRTRPDERGWDTFDLDCSIALA